MAFEAAHGDAVSIDFTVGPTLVQQTPRSAILGLLEESGGIGSQYRPGPIVQLDGTISLKLNGAELLGPDYWFELFNLIHLVPLVTGAVSVAWEQVATETSIGKVRFESLPEDDQVRFEVVLNGTPQHSAVLPLRPLVNAWTFLALRIRRLQAHLGDGPSISAIERPAGFFGEDYFDVVEDGLVEEIRTAPLEQLLANPEFLDRASHFPLPRIPSPRIPSPRIPSPRINVNP